MARKSTKAAEIEDSEPEAIEEESGEDEAGEPRISKAEAARRTLAEGITLPREASVHIKQKYGLEISPQQFSAEKSRMKLRSGGLPGGGHSQGRLEAYTAPATGGSGGSNGDPGLLEALEAIKPLIETLGAEKVKRMVDLLG